MRQVSSATNSGTLDFAKNKQHLSKAALDLGEVIEHVDS